MYVSRDMQMGCLPCVTLTASGWSVMVGDRQQQGVVDIQGFETPDHPSAWVLEKNGSVLGCAPNGLIPSERVPRHCILRSLVVAQSMVTMVEICRRFDPPGNT